jgi:hypothetical protein
MAAASRGPGDTGASAASSPRRKRAVPDQGNASASVTDWNARRRTARSTWTAGGPSSTVGRTRLRQRSSDSLDIEGSMSTAVAPVFITAKTLAKSSKLGGISTSARSPGFTPARSSARARRLQAAASSRLEYVRARRVRDSTT